MTVLDRIEQQAKEAADTAARMAKMAEVVRELGEDGLAELVALIGAEAPQNGNGHANGDGHTPDTAKAVPRGREAVRLIVRKRPGIWTYKELRAEMQRLEWFTTDSGLEAAAKRLCDSDGEGRRIGKGRYVFPADHGEEDTIESERSDGALISFTPLALTE